MPEYCQQDIKPIDIAPIIENFTAFIERYSSFIITTHDPPDADGLGAQLVCACILKARGKKYRIINASPVPEQLEFMGRQGAIEQWDAEKHGRLPENAAAIMLDTSDMHYIGLMRDPICRCKEVFIIDHHDTIQTSLSSGYCDSKAASATELAVEIALNMGVALSPEAASAAYIGIASDTGFFAYPKTGPRTFRIALALLEAGAPPNEAYRLLRENAPNRALLLQKKAFASLELHCSGRAAMQVLRLEDFSDTGAVSDDTDGLVNVPLRSREVIVSALIKEARPRKVKCSLRSKGAVDVSKIARDLGGGGHINAAAYKSDLSVDQTIAITLAKIAEYLELVPLEQVPLDAR